MKKSINLQGQDIEYSLKESKRAKTMRITMYPDGSCVVTIPKTMQLTAVEKFLVAKSQWILTKIRYFAKHKGGTWKKGSREEYLKYKDKALEIVESRIEYFNTFYGYTWNKITIKNQKTRWGSCSRKGNLNFNYKIALLPQKMSDYIIIHELCHLGEFNHSQKFWNLVAKGTPDYLDIRKDLKKHGLEL